MNYIYMIIALIILVVLLVLCFIISKKILKKGKGGIPNKNIEVLTDMAIDVIWGRTIPKIEGDYKIITNIKNGQITDVIIDTETVELRFSESGNKIIIPKAFSEKMAIFLNAIIIWIFIVLILLFIVLVIKM